MISTLTVYFEGPFWVAVLERQDEEGYSAARVVLGNEPSDAELWQFLVEGWDRFVFSPVLKDVAIQPRKLRPKKALKEAVKEFNKSPGTRAQRALAEQREANKTERRRTAKETRLEKQDKVRELKVIKNKAKHRGK